MVYEAIEAVDVFLGRYSGRHPDDYDGMVWSHEGVSTLVGDVD